MSAPSFELLKETIRNDEIVVVAGAGIHALNTNNNSTPEINKARKTLKDWNVFLKHVAQLANIDTSLLDNPELSPTLKWELLVNRIKGDLPADKKEKILVDYVQQIAFNNETLLYYAYDLYSPVLQIIHHQSVKHIINLNIDLTLEMLLQQEIGAFSSNGDKGIDRHFTFNGNKQLTSWHPHGDRKNKASITFGLRQYANILKEVEDARSKFKLNEYTKTAIKPTSWVDLFMSKPLLFIGTSIDKAEWDIWLALVNRWRNYGRDDNKKHENPVFVLTRNESHTHLPPDKFVRLEAPSYEESWAHLLEIFET